MRFAKKQIMMQVTDKKLELQRIYVLFAKSSEGYIMLLSNIFYLHLDTKIIEHEDMNATGKSCPVAFFSLNPPLRGKIKRFEVKSNCIKDGGKIEIKLA